ncbi:MAG: PD-(D/E)XK nuclease family protein [Lachnospiraceae bacterium]|nr:PD-(D/E)XK nuclease family protein [Lachnospiraceae bacterium]
MGLEFVIGGCGSGKSRSLYERALKGGGNYVFLVPDQSTSSVQQELIRLHPRHVISGIDVAGFTQYAYRTFERTGLTAPTVLDDVGKKMILQKVMGSVAKDLKVYHGQVGRTGFTEKMKSFLSECRQYKITPEKLSEVSGSGAHSDLLEAKLSDVRLIMQAFDDALGGQYATAEELQLLLAGQICRDPMVPGTTYVLDGFTGFTPIQYDVIRELLHHARRVIVVLTATSKKDLTGRDAEKGLFSLSAVTYRKLSELADAECVIAEETVLPEGRSIYHPALTFAAARFGTDGGSLSEEDPEEKERLLQEALSLTSYADIRTEVRAAARAIRSDVVKDGLRYQDIAVTLTDPDSYGPVVEEIFPEYQIPFFIDRKRNLSSNPLIAYIEAALAVIEEDFSYASVFACIRCGFTVLSPEEADELENYVLATGKRGFKSWGNPWEIRSKKSKRTPEEMDRINSLRERFYGQMKPLKKAAGAKGATVRDRLTALYEFLLSSKVPEKLEERKAFLNNAGMTDLEREYDQVFRKVVNVFSLYEKLMGDEVLTPECFADILREGLAEQKIGLVPPSLDRLVVGDLTRTRYGNVRRLYVLGMNESLIPSAGAESGVLSRSERSVLKGELEMAPTAEEKIRQQEYYCYLLFSKPTERLSISCNISSDRGEEGKPSPYMSRLIRLSETFEKKNARAVTETADAGSIGAPEADRSLLVQARLKDTQAWFLALYDSFRTMPAYERFLKLLEQGVSFGYRPDHLRPETASKLFPEEKELSVSRLETFAKCQYSYFLKYSLGLNERDLFRFESVDFGNLCHDILDQVFRIMQEEGLSWRALADVGSDPERKSRADVRRRLLDKCLEDPEFLSSYNGVEEDSAEMRSMLEKSRDMIDLCMEAVAYHMTLGSFEQVGSEITFGSGFGEEEGTVPPLTIRSEDGTAVKLHGKIDRLDAAVAENGTYYHVVDYKTGETKFRYERFLAGTQLQLMIYLMAAKEYLKQKGSDVTEGGMYYFNLQDIQVDFDHKYKELKENWEKDVSEKAYKKLKMNGCLIRDNEYLGRLETVQGKNSSIVTGLAYPAVTDPEKHVLVEADQMREMEEKAGTIVSDLVRSIRHGEIEVNPYLPTSFDPNGSCKYCPMKSVCKFTPDLEGFQGRRLKKG